jgi:hypothetical protein
METEEYQEEDKKGATLFLEIVVTVFLAVVFLVFFIKFLFF